MFPCLGKVLYVFVGVFDSLGVVEGVAVVDFLDEIFFLPIREARLPLEGSCRRRIFPAAI